MPILRPSLPDFHYINLVYYYFYNNNNVLESVYSIQAYYTLETQYIDIHTWMLAIVLPFTEYLGTGTKCDSNTLHLHVCVCVYTELVTRGIYTRPKFC